MHASYQGKKDLLIKPFLTYTYTYLRGEDRPIHLRQGPHADDFRVRRNVTAHEQSWTQITCHIMWVVKIGHAYRSRPVMVKPMCMQCIFLCM